MGDGCEKMVGPPSNLDSSSSESIDGDIKSHIHLLHKPSAISFGHSMITSQVNDDQEIVQYINFNTINIHILVYSETHSFIQ
jgi:hypothetical protein